jgi:glycosyltransferase involved in cell wall biosynthesis
MRISQILLRFDAPGGVETTTREVSKELRRGGHSVRIFASDLYDESGWIRDPNPSREVDGLPVLRFPAIKRLIPGLTLPLLPGLVDALSREETDVLHAHSHRYGHVLQTALVARARGVPFVVSTHYHPPHPSEPPSKKALLRAQDHLFGLFAYRQAGAIVVETQFEASQVSDFVDPRKVLVVPPGLSPLYQEEIPDAASYRRRLGLPDRYLLFAGRLAPNKGLPFLLEAYAGLAPERRVPLVFLGRDWGMKELLLRHAQDRRIADRLVWLGERPDPREYRAVLAGATALVLPSEYEAFGLVLLEAMACGCPPVATRVGGVPEAVRENENALLVNYSDVAGLRDALDRILSDPLLRERLSRAGRQWARQFSWTRTADGYLEAYRRAGAPGP